MLWVVFAQSMETRLRRLSMLGQWGQSTHRWVRIYLKESCKFVIINKFYLYECIFLIDIYAYMNVCVTACIPGFLWRPKKRVRSPRVIDCCKHYVGAGNPTLLVWKNNQSSQSHNNLPSSMNPMLLIKSS